MYVNCEKSSNHSNITLRMGKIIRALKWKKNTEKLFKQNENNFGKFIKSIKWNETMKNHSNETKIMEKSFKRNGKQ